MKMRLAEPRFAQVAIFFFLLFLFFRQICSLPGKVIYDI